MKNKPAEEQGGEGARPLKGGAQAPPPNEQWKPLPFRPRRRRPGSHGDGAVPAPARTAPPRPAPLPARLLSATSVSGGDVVYAEPLRHPAAGRPGP